MNFPVKRNEGKSKQERLQAQTSAEIVSLFLQKFVAFYLDDAYKMPFIITASIKRKVFDGKLGSNVCDASLC